MKQQATLILSSLNVLHFSYQIIIFSWLFDSILALMFTVPDLTYQYNALEPFVDEATMRVHHDGHHATYVKNLNEALSGQDLFLNMDIENLLKSLNQLPEDIRAKVKNNAGGHYHHSLFWTFLAPPSRRQSAPSGILLESIAQTFGDFNSFQEEFNKSAASLFGSGWTWVVLDQGKLKIINTPNQDSPISSGQDIILGLDLWEHAYYLKYQNKRAEYISAWWNVVNWSEVEKRFHNFSSLSHSS